MFENELAEFLRIIEAKEYIVIGDNIAIGRIHCFDDSAIELKTGNDMVQKISLSNLKHHGFRIASQTEQAMYKILNEIKPINTLNYSAIFSGGWAQ